MTINDIIHDLRMAENLTRECDEYYGMDSDLEEIADTIENSICNLEIIIEDLEYIQGGIGDTIENSMDKLMVLLSILKYQKNKE